MYNACRPPPYSAAKAARNNLAQRRKPWGTGHAQNPKAREGGCHTIAIVGECRPPSRARGGRRGRPCVRAYARVPGLTPVSQGLRRWARLFRPAFAGLWGRARLRGPVGDRNKKGTAGAVPFFVSVLLSYCGFAKTSAPIVGFTSMALIITVADGSPFCMTTALCGCTRPSTFLKSE